MIKAYNVSKDIIKDGERVPVIITNEAPLKRLKNEVVIHREGNISQITISSIPISEYCNSRYLHLSGVNVLFYIVCLYFTASKVKGTYYQYQTTIKTDEKTKILKNNTFIFDEDKSGFWYFEVSRIKSTPYFLFDLPSTNQMIK